MSETTRPGGPVTAFGLRHKGLVREEDQDYLLFWGHPDLDTRPVDLKECLDAQAGSRFLSPTRLFVVADGMGGLDEGASAAQTACHTAFNAFRDLALEFNLRVFSSPLPHLSRGLAEDAQRVLLHAVEAANEPVWREGQGRCGSTLMVATVCDQQLLVAAAGDCRAYLLQPNGKLDLLTRDDNLAWEATSSGRLSHAEAAEEGLTSRLTKYLGMGPRVNPTGYALPIAAGGRLLLCTDGLYGSFPDERPIARLARVGDIHEAAEGLVAGALARGGHDNISALLVDIPSGEAPPSDTLLPATPVARRKPGISAWVRQRKRQAVAGRWGTKLALASVLTLGLVTGLWLGLGDVLGRAESVLSSEPRGDGPGAIATSVTVPPTAPGQAAFGSPVSLGRGCEPAAGQICPDPGDTLESLAARVGVEIQVLATLNPNVPLKEPLRPDVPLRLPSGGVPRTAPAP